MFKTSKTIISASLIPIGLKLTKLTKMALRVGHSNFTQLQTGGGAGGADGGQG